VKSSTGEIGSVMLSVKRLVFVALLHYPLVNRNGAEVTTAVTNLDIHDIARSCKTYGVTKYFIVNPEEEQERLVKSILQHWEDEVAAIYHPSRAQALGIVEFVRTFEEAYNEASRNGKLHPFVVMPDARDLREAKDLEEAWSYEDLRQRLESGKLSEKDDGSQPLIIVFGTGWGVAPAFYKHVYRPLKPLKGTSKYNHLSVRAAAAIILDKLFGMYKE
jgi:hypothetical protein